jgi:hypothetical protein
VAVVLDHALDATDLSFDPIRALDQCDLVVTVLLVRVDHQA